jgi:hypothetical protein
MLLQRFKSANVYKTPKAPYSNIMRTLYELGDAATQAALNHRGKLFPASINPA